MASALSTVNLRDTSDTPTVTNNAGGDTVYLISDEERFRRFLVLGSDSGSYYQSAREMTDRAIKALKPFILENPEWSVDQAVEVSTSGRAPKNDQALFVLALVASFAKKADQRNYALSQLSAVARTGTHLFQFVHFVSNMRGWGRALKRAVADWYTDKDPDDMAYQLVKYRQRNGWAHRDVLRLAHPSPTNAEQSAALSFAVGKEFHYSTPPKIITDFKAVQGQPLNASIAELYAASSDLPWEAYPTQHLNNPSLWRSLITNNRVPYTALLRQLPRLTSIGVFDNREFVREEIVPRLASPSYVRRSRIHPVNVLVALRTYSSGSNQYGKVWMPNRDVVNALDEAFYLSFTNVEATGKRILIAVDVSGSMDMPIAGKPITAREMAVGMAMPIVDAEDNVDVVGFTSKDDNWRHNNNILVDLDLSRRRRIDDIIRETRNLPFGGTDCSLPMEWALDNNKQYDSFVVMTDSETWSGGSAADALRKYRRKTGINARLAVAAFAVNDFTIADPNDPGMLDLVGFDSAMPNVLGSFISEEI